MREMVMDDYRDDFDTRSRWLRAAAICLGTVVAAAAAFGVARWSAPAPSGGQRATVSSQSGPGPWRVENGVPVGYAHTPDGAVAAATNFLMVVDGPLMLRPTDYRAAISALAAPEARAKLRNDAEVQMATFQSIASLNTYAQQGRAVVFRAVPLTYHMEQYDGRTGRVSIWAESFVAVDGVLALRETWSTSTCTVEWIDGDWRLRGIDPPSSASAGPVPIVMQASSQSVALPPQLKDYERYRNDVAP